MTGPVLVAFVLATLAALWISPGGSRVGSLALAVTAEAIVLGSATGWTLAPEVGWGGDGGAIDSVLAPYGIAVAVGWAGGVAIGAAARRLRGHLRRPALPGPAEPGLQEIWRNSGLSRR